MPFKSKLEWFIESSIRVSATISIVIVALIFIFLFKEAAPFLSNPGLSALVGSEWRPTSLQEIQFGMLPLITGSLLVTILATLIALPFGVLSAVYIAEIAGPREREILKPCVELLAAIPSVVLGFFGLVVVGPLIKDVFGLDSSLNALNGAVLLALMAIPTIISISEDALRSVPHSYREASLALGANRLNTVFRVVVPAASSGIFAAVMLGMGRVIGETMAVLMVTGNASKVAFSPFESVRTMTATIAAEMGEVTQGSDHYQSLFWIGIVLLTSTFILNVLSQRVLQRYDHKT